MPRLNGYGGDTDQWGLTQLDRDDWYVALFGFMALAMAVSLILYAVI
jgi:hypothetical protein